jgi:hypothetical protein
MGVYMKKIVAAYLSLVIMTLIGFQNCSGSSAGESSASSTAAQSQDPRATLNSAQQQASKVMSGTLTSAQELQAALQSLQQLLTQIQAINSANLSAALQQLDQQLIQQLTTDINQLEAQLAALNGDNSCSFNGQTVASGGSITAYQSSSVPSGQTCQSQTRTCDNGQLSGAYTFAACSSPAATTCSPGGYQFLNCGSQSGPAYLCPYGGENSFSEALYLQINSVQPDGTFSALVGPYAADGGDYPVTGKCLNGNISFSFSYGAGNFYSYSATGTYTATYTVSFSYGTNPPTFSPPVPGSGILLNFQYGEGPQVVSGQMVGIVGFLPSY